MGRRPACYQKYLWARCLRDISRAHGPPDRVTSVTPRYGRVAGLVDKLY
jgi:hypothetical protein